MDFFSSEIYELADERLCDQTRGKLLTKSKFLNGLQCPKLLWIRCNQPDLVPEPSKTLQKIFDTGREVGYLATLCFPGGEYLQEDDFQKNIEQTQELLKSGWNKPIYEAGILSGRLYSRADILKPSNNKPNAWDIVEVKCSTKCKEVHLQDIAFQKFCYESAGLEIDRSFLMHINNKYIRDGDIKPEEFFHLIDVTDEIKPFSESLPQLAERFLKIIDTPNLCEQSIGRHCNNPYECVLKDYCWGVLPEANVTELYRDNGGKRFKLLNQGIEKLEDIPDNFNLNEKHHIQRSCARTGQVHVDREAIEKFLEKLKFPLYFMDFETIFEAIPRFDGCWPYQQVPFQFSVHIKKSPNGEVFHHEFLAQGRDNPIEGFVESLQSCLGNEGSIIVYYESFEKSRIKEIAEILPQYDQWSKSILNRIVDLLVPFQQFHYYDPRQAGTASIKTVYPVLVGGSGYKDMDISDGAQASLEYLRVTFDDNVLEEEKNRVYQSLKKYCGLDTYAMVEILNKLYALS